MEPSIPMLTCPVCHFPIQPTWYFCPNCGKELNSKPVAVSAWKQIGIYFVSLFLPPLGFWPGVRYLEKTGRQAKIVGTVAIVLTIISTAASAWLIYRYMQNSLSIYNGLLNGAGYGL